MRTAGIDALPNELLLRVFTGLPFLEKVRLRSVCSRWSAVAAAALQQHDAIGIGDLSSQRSLNVRSHMCHVHHWHVDTIDTISSLQLAVLLEECGEKRCRLQLMYPNLKVLVVGPDVDQPERLAQMFSPTLICLSIQSRDEDQFNWSKGMNLLCYRRPHLSDSLLQASGQLQYLYCESRVAVHLLGPAIRHLTCRLQYIAELSRHPIARHLESLNVEVDYQHQAADGVLSFPAVDYIRIEIPFSQPFLRSFIPKKNLVKLILDFSGASQNVTAVDLMAMLTRVTSVKQLSLQFLPGPHPQVTDQVIQFISETFRQLEELRLEVRGASFTDSSLTSLSSLENLMSLMIRCGSFPTLAILNFMETSASLSTLKRLILVSRLKVNSKQLEQPIAHFKAKDSLRDVWIHSVL